MQWHCVLAPSLLLLPLGDLAMVYTLLSLGFFWKGHEFSMPCTHLCKFASFFGAYHFACPQVWFWAMFARGTSLPVGPFQFCHLLPYRDLSKYPFWQIHKVSKLMSQTSHGMKCTPWHHMIKALLQQAVAQLFPSFQTHCTETRAKCLRNHKEPRQWWKRAVVPLLGH